MISRTFLAQLEKNISVGKGQAADGSTFGGINVILCGDFHQFPPVATAKNETLYFPIHSGVDTLEQQVGRKIYEEFTTVVILKQQMRVVDNVWKDILSRLRHGRVSRSDIDILRGLVLGHPNCPATNFDDAEWKKAALVTSRHGVRRAWNDTALRKHCKETGHRIYICHSDDTIKGRPLTLAEEYGMALRSSQKTATGRRRDTKNDLPETISILIGAEVMVVENIETDLDIANGARGTIVDIVLNPEEPAIPDDATVVDLKHQPLYILVKMKRTRTSQLDGLEEGVIPIRPWVRTMRISVQQRQGPPAHRTVKRLQYPLTLAYAFTDYRAQGQTIIPVIIDIATPPGGALNLFNIYVALSRSSSRDTVRLLRGFDEAVFLQGHSAELMMEDDRLEGLNSTTQEWWKKMIENDE